MNSLLLHNCKCGVEVDYSQKYSRTTLFEFYLLDTWMPIAILGYIHHKAVICDRHEYCCLGTLTMFLYKNINNEFDHAELMQ